MNASTTRVAVALAIAVTPAVGVAPAAAVPVTITVHETGLESLNAVSRTGRYVVGSEVLYGRPQLRDLATGTRVALLPQKASRPSLSDNGRYVAYTLPVGEWGRQKVMLFDRRKATTTNVTRRSDGALLKPTWRSRCTLALCEEDQKLRYSPQLAGGQISGNGRYVVFSANFRKPGKIDVYLKDLRTGKLTVFKGAGRVHLAEGDTEQLQAPSVSEDARTILIPGRLESYESGNTWQPGRAVFDRTRLVDIGGVGNTMTRDGRTITINGSFSGADEGTPIGVVWYDVATATSIPADPPTMRLNLGTSSRDGRYVVWKASMADPLQIRDRTAAVSYDLQAALTAAGYAVNPSAGAPGSFVWGYPDTAAAMSGDGLVAFVDTSAGIVAVTWTP
ncbi:MAG: hypothetical protein IPG68_13250 [Micrococcales bacterium]|nr:hypothetical protein [Micrococcales bacterium]